MANLITNEYLLDLVLTRCNSAAGLAEGSAPGSLKISNAITYSIGGRMYSKAATDNIRFLDDYEPQVSSTTRFYAICIDDVGAVSFVQGFNEYDFPEKTTGTCLLGFVKSVAGDVAIARTYIDVAVAPLATSF